MSLLNNMLSIYTARFVLGVGSRSVVVGREHLPAVGKPVVLAISHMSHYDPMVVSALLRRKIDWMARAEFYRSPGSRWACEHCDCIELDRDGHALPGIREALRRLGKNRLVGIFPEGELTSGPESVLNGGPIRGGAALLARRAGRRQGETGDSGAVPVVPCVVLNSDQHRRVTPWLPLRSGRLWVGLGPPLYTPPDARPGRASRVAMTERIAEAIRNVYRDLCADHDVPAEVRP